MKTNFASTLAFMPLLSIVSAMEVSDVYKKTLGNSDCANIHLTGNHVLHANCERPGYGTHTDYELDLNKCFANYLGTLNYIPNGNGGFGGSCSPCKMSGTKLVCECSVGRRHGTRHNEVELNDWNVIQIQDAELTCASTEGIEKRAVGKEARLFAA
ncbi:hypothetical protein F4781DRAFT_303411 [Annulohypoxylon bovei var. microspora]|nr:hypothetical protein F4781DRAFT_303411 [Annulohypoxylon bovei var. microspora]